MSYSHKPSKCSYFFGTFQVISATLLLMLQDAYAMEPEESEDVRATTKPLNYKRSLEFRSKKTDELLELQQEADRKSPEACFKLGKYLYEEELNKTDRSQDIEKYQLAQMYLQIAAAAEHQEAKIYLDKVNISINPTAVSTKKRTVDNREKNKKEGSFSEDSDSSDSEQEIYFNRKTFGDELAKRLLERSSSGPVIIPQGALKNSQPIQLDVPQRIEGPSLAERRAALQKKLVFRESAPKEESPSLEPENTSPSKSFHAKSPVQEVLLPDSPSHPIQPSELLEEVTEESHSLQLIDLILKNLHDPKLEITVQNILPLIEGIGFEALCRSKSIRELAFKDVLLDTRHWLALGHVLSRNQSIKRLDLSGAKFTEHDLTILAYALKRQKTLRELILLHPEFKVTDQHVIRFYDLIKENQGLRFIAWPEDKGIKKALCVLSGEEKYMYGNPELSRVALLHRGVQFAQEGESQDVITALRLLKEAHELEHPLAAYEIGKIYKRQGKNDEYKRQENYDKAFKWYSKAQQKGLPEAQVQVGDYLRAIWPQQNTDKLDRGGAFINYEHAARAGNRKGLYRLGRMYERERDMPGNLEMAATLFFQSGEKGYCDAFTALGALYRDPEYSGYNLDNSRWYLEWATKFKKTEGVAKRLLTDRGH